MTSADGHAGEPVLYLSPANLTVVSSSISCDSVRSRTLPHHGDYSGGRLMITGCWSLHARQPHRHAGIESDTGRKLGAVHGE